MKLDFGGTVLRINTSFAAAVTLTLIIDESGFCAAALFCCAVHEIGHIICLYIIGEKPKLIELSFYGIKLERRNEALCSAENIAVFASGPLANLVLSAALFAFGRSDGMKSAAVISLCVGVFNLLPCEPLDGGNILKTFLARIMSEEMSRKISFCTSFFVIIPMLTGGIFLLIKNRNITLVAVSAYLISINIVNAKKSLHS